MILQVVTIYHHLAGGHPGHPHPPWLPALHHLLASHLPTTSSLDRLTTQSMMMMLMVVVVMMVMMVMTMMMVVVLMVTIPLLRPFAS